jgi:hypothetical protein
MTSDQEQVTPAPAAPSVTGPFVRWLIIGGLIGGLSTLIVLAAMHRDQTPNLTPALFEAAHDRWKKAAPPDYDIEVHVSGPQGATYRVEVRDGQPQAAWRNGDPLTSRRTFGTWSVPGMFGTISRDLETVDRHAAGRTSEDLLLRAAFEPKYSYPERYRRIQWGSRRGSDAITVAWEVTTFRVLPPTTP